MPWHIEEQDGKYCVIKDSDNSVEKCYDTRSEADDLMAALYANEPEERMNENVLRRLWDRIKGAFEEAGIASPPNERAMALSRLYQQVDSMLYEASEGYPWLMDVYMDDGQTYAVAADGGKLYRYDVMVDGETVALGERVQVTEVHAPMSRTVVRQQEDGRYRWFSISATAVLNRVGEIDSRELFDNFARRAKETGDYPYRTFFHKGEQFKTGQADFLARDGDCYITSGLYDEDNELAQAEIKARQDNPDYWGESIGYVPLGAPEMVQIGEVKVPVYRDGVNEEISTLPEQRAASWFTISNVEVNRMLKDVEFEAFVELFDGDEDKARSWLETNVDATNRQIAERGMVTRSDEPEQETPPESDAEPASTELAQDEPAAEPQDSAPIEREVELDEEAVGAIVRAVVESDDLKALAEMPTGLEALQASVESLARSLETIQGNVGELDKRVMGLERDDDGKRRDWLADLPARSRTVVTYRPREEHRNDDETNEPLAERAARIMQEKRGGK